MTAFEAEKRLEKLRKKVLQKKQDACLILDPVNRLYFTGFSSSAGILLVPAEEEPVFYTDFRYLEMARREIPFMKTQKLEDVPAQLGGLAGKKKWKCLAFEARISTARFRSLRQALAGVENWTEFDGPIAALRAVKSAAEVQAIRRAVRLGDEVYAKTLQELQPGMTERDGRRLLRYYMDLLGAEGESFDSIVSFGANSSQPHAHITDKVLRRNQPCLIDMGVRLGHYCSDMTRVVFFGKPSPKMKEIYKIVLEAQQRAMAFVKPGVTAAELDAVARDFIARKGYRNHFGHSLGHGVGLEVHEDPRLAGFNKQPLKTGMVITLEPGIYLPGVGGVRIENMVAVKTKGAENLTETPRELRCL